MKSSSPCRARLLAIPVLVLLILSVIGCGEVPRPSSPRSSEARPAPDTAPVKTPQPDPG